MTQKILIADDDPTILRVEEYNLKKAGYDVITAVDGEDALRKIEEEKPQLIVLDVMMPGIDGYEVCRRIKDDRLKSHIPIIMLTVKKEVEDRVKGLKTGANDYLIKPFHPQELVARIEANLRQVEYDIQANPLTRLPGNISIENKINERIDSERNFSILYLDLDNFKVFNDTYGYRRGDEIIKLTTRIIVKVVETSGNSDDFIGHIGGDDFIVLTTPEKVDAICKQIIAEFDSTVPSMYDEEDKKRGFLLCQDRRGQNQRFPIMSISIACITNEKKRFSHTGEISKAAAEGKKYVKAIAGSTYVKDRRQECSKPFFGLIKIVSKLENLSQTADFIQQATQNAGLNESDKFDVLVAVQEACENIIQYGYSKCKKGSIKIRCESEDDGFVVRIRDEGKSFDPNSAPEPDIDSPLEERSPGGLGIYFMKNLMDEVYYNFDPQKGNELIMKKYITQER